MVYGTVYSVPEEIGPFDISTFGSVLTHVRDPFLALQNATRLTKETVIITELVNDREEKHMVFTPDTAAQTWWRLPPAVIEKFLEVLGFEKTGLEYHYQKHQGDKRLLYTLVGHRTSDIRATLYGKGKDDR